MANLMPITYPLIDIQKITKLIILSTFLYISVVWSAAAVPYTVRYPTALKIYHVMCYTCFLLYTLSCIGASTNVGEFFTSPKI